jgi:drug/metabolite transporter (DMT)-like permease
MRPWTNSEYARDALYGLAAVCIRAGFIVVSRLGVTTSLTPWDVAAIRFSVAGLLLLPYLLKQGLAFDRLGWTGYWYRVDYWRSIWHEAEYWPRALPDRGLVWACYTVAMRRARLDGLHAAAIAGVGSLVFYLPAYASFAGAHV